MFPAYWDRLSAGTIAPFAGIDAMRSGKLIVLLVSCASFATWAGVTRQPLADSPPRTGDAPTGRDTPPVTEVFGGREVDSAAKPGKSIRDDKRWRVNRKQLTARQRFQGRIFAGEVVTLDDFPDCVA